MNDLALVGMQVRYEQKQFWRNPPSAFFAVIFPVMFLVIFASIFKSSRVAQLQNIDFTQYYIPAILAFGVVGATFTNLAITMSIRRELGLLKRLRATPLPPWVYIAGVVGNAIVISILLVAVTMLVGVLFYGVTFPNRWAGLVLDVVVGALSFCSLGVGLSTLIPNGDAAPAVTNAVLFPVVFISGTFFYIDSGSTVTRIAQVFPLKHFINTVFSAFDPHASGIGANGNDLLIMASWGAAGLLLAMRRFRWEPTRS